MSLDNALVQIKQVLQHEQEAGHVNSLDGFAQSQHRREVINRQWQNIQATLAPVQQQIQNLSPLPPEGEILWARAALAMRALAFLEIDTTLAQSH